MDRNEALKMLNGLAETFDRVVPALSKDFRCAVEAMKDDKNPLNWIEADGIGAKNVLDMIAIDACILENILFVKYMKNVIILKFLNFVNSVVDRLQRKHGRNWRGG